MMIRKKTIFVLAFWAAAWAGCGAALAQGDDAGDMVTCTDTTLKVDAPNVKPSDLIREIGDKCGIKVVVIGDAFDGNQIGVKFQELPIRKGIERVLRIANLSNFVLHLDSDPLNPRIVELDIMGKKGGERQLTAGTSRPAPPPRGQSAKPRPARGAPPATAQGKASIKPPAEDKTAPKGPADPNELALEKSQEEFMKVMEEMMKAQEMGEEPDPAEVLRIFKEVVPQEVRDQIPPEVLKELEDLQNNPQQFPGIPLPPGKQE